MEDRCECGQRFRCPRSGETVLANRSGVPFLVTRTMEDGDCLLTVHHLEGGAEGLPMRCSDPSPEDQLALRQMHMLGARVTPKPHLVQPAHAAAEVSGGHPVVQTPASPSYATPVGKSPKPRATPPSARRPA